MSLFLAILSVLASWAFLATLIVGLLLILKPLEGVRSSLQRIAMGVRAIERQTVPLGEDVLQLASSIDKANQRLNGFAEQMARVEEDLDKAAPGMLRHL